MYFIIISPISVREVSSECTRFSTGQSIPRAHIMKYKSGSGQSGKRWKVRAQFKWCADQNYGFEVWSKGLPACNQRCDNRWAHRKCLIMSIIIMNGCATTTSMCQRTRCRRKKMNRSSAEREKENGKKNIETRAQFTVINTKQKAVSRTYRFDCVPVFHRYFSLFLYRCPSVQCQRWLCVFSTSSFRSFGMAKRLVCSYLLVWFGCCCYLFSSFFIKCEWIKIFSFHLLCECCYLVAGRLLLAARFFLLILSLIRLMSICHWAASLRSSFRFYLFHDCMCQQLLLLF